MKISDKISRKLRSIKEGEVFTYSKLGISKDEYVAAAKAIERLIKQGRLQRMSPGVFYISKQSVFGTLKPAEEQLLKPYLYDANQRIAYETGPSLYNRLGLTTQISKSIKVASRDKEIKATIGNLKIRSTKSYTNITEDNYQLLQILDVIKDFKKIPDKDDTVSIGRLTALITTLTPSQTEKIIKLATKYPPRVAALLGAIISSFAPFKDLTVLQKRLNPFTSYNFGINATLLPTVGLWNIK